MVWEGVAGRALVAGILGRSGTHGEHAYRYTHGDAGRVRGREPHGGPGSGRPLRALAGPARAAVAALGRARRPRVALAAAEAGAAARHPSSGPGAREGVAEPHATGACTRDTQDSPRRGDARRFARNLTEGENRGCAWSWWDSAMWGRCARRAWPIAGTTSWAWTRASSRWGSS